MWIITASGVPPVYADYHYWHDYMEESEKLAQGIPTTPTRQHQATDLNLFYDENLQLIYLRDGENPILDAVDEEHLEPGPLTIDWKSILFMTLDDYAVKMERVRQTEKERNGNWLIESRRQKTLRIQLPCQEATETFLRRLQECHPEYKLPIYSLEYRSISNCHTIHSISIDGDKLTATKAGETLFIGSHEAIMVILAKDGFSKPEWCRYSFSLRDVFHTRCNYNTRGVTYILSDGRIVSIELKGWDGARCYVSEYACRVLEFSTWAQQRWEARWGGAGEADAEENDDPQVEQPDASGVEA